MLAIVLALASAVGYGGSDFAAGLASRSAGIIQISLLASVVSLVTGAAALPFTVSHPPAATALAWGAVAGLGGNVGALALYYGYRQAAFSVAGPLSAVGAAGFSVLAGLLYGERLTGLALTGVVLALPAIVGVSASAATTPTGAPGSSDLPGTSGPSSSANPSDPPDSFSSPDSSGPPYPSPVRRLRIRQLPFSNRGASSHLSPGSRNRLFMWLWRSTDSFRYGATSMGKAESGAAGGAAADIGTGDSGVASGGTGDSGAGDSGEAEVNSGAADSGEAEVNSGAADSRVAGSGAGLPGRPVAGVVAGLVAGAGFALLFIGLDRAGSGSGLWPVAGAQAAELVAAVGVAAVTGNLRLPAARPGWLAVTTGVTGALGTISYFFATHEGFLAVTAVLTSLYPAVTIVAARIVVGERLTVLRLAGLALAAACVALIAVGGAR